MSYAEEVVLNVLALDKAFTDYELFHAYLGPRRLRERAARIPVARARQALERLREDLETAGIPDEAPDYRRTYYRDFLGCVLAQVDTFVLRRRGRPFAQRVESLMAAPVPRPFALEAGLRRLKAELREAGFRSVQEYRRAKKQVRFQRRTQLADYVYAIVDDVTAQLTRRGAPAFPADLRRLLSLSRLRVVAPRADEPPCFYRYEGNYRGTLGLALERDFSEPFVRAFVLHEAMPGHHLYYLLKQDQLDRGGADILAGTDTFYSPENPINEGLAVCADMSFGRMLDPMTHLGVQVEKFLHRVFYNAWHQVNVARSRLDARLLRLLREELDFAEPVLRQKLAYHTRSARYYTPVYSLGIAAVERLAPVLGPERLHLLYRQHSINTLRKLRLRHAPTRRP